MTNNDSIGLFLDGNLVDSYDIPYPRLENSNSTTYHVGDQSNNAQAAWSLASSYLFSVAVGNELPRLFHHLGPRYTSNFQSTSLMRFFTYEAATSLSIFLQSLIDSKRPYASELTSLLKGVKDGTGIPEESIVFALNPVGYQEADSDRKDATVLNSSLRKERARERAKVIGDVVVAKPQCLDVSVWKIGGAAIPLRLVELTRVIKFSSFMLQRLTGLR